MIQSIRETTIQYTPENMLAASVEDQIKQARLLSARLERISADSIWARRASGHRGALLKWIERYEMQTAQKGLQPIFSGSELEKLGFVIQSGYHVLEQAAKERLR